MQVKAPRRPGIVAGLGHPGVYLGMPPPHAFSWTRPQPGDCGDYYFRYIDLVPDVDILTYLHTQRDWFGEWIAGFSEEQARFRYAPGKWSLAETIGHVLDTERVFAFRMLAVSRGDTTSLPGFEQDDYVANSIYDSIRPADLAREWDAVRSASITLAQHMDETMAARMGTANNLPVRARAFPYLMAGHALHHYQVGRERYLGQG